MAPKTTILSTMIMLIGLVSSSAASRVIPDIVCPTCVCCHPRPLGGGCCTCCTEPVPINPTPTPVPIKPQPPPPLMPAPVTPTPIRPHPPIKDPIYCPACVCCGPKPLRGCCKCCGADSP